MVFKPILTKKDIREIAAEFKKSLRKAGIRARLLLFGSYARNKPHAWSDVDICVLSSQFGKRDFDDMMKISKIAKQVSYMIEAFPLNPKDLESEMHPLAGEIKKTGIMI